MRYGKCVGTSVDLLLPSQTQPYLSSVPGWRSRARCSTSPVSRWRYEDGLVRIPPDEALKLAPHGIPLNWIYEGKMTNLPPHVRAIIRELQREPAKR